jgi:hypothetical protein
MFWASTEAVTGHFPTEYPEDVGLVEVVAMNARLEPFHKLLERYPSVTITKM